ncbi:MAG TPA: dienelactone hydrolase family protein [Allosphingosinicella sp.]|nr:dienelactone hydrolase family protein [Allosphingosinicella sp.]
MKLTLKILGGLVALVVLLLAALAIYLFATALEPSRPVGFQQVTAADPGHPPIAVNIWYPTDAKPGFVLLGSTGQRVATGGPVTGTGLKLVVISHGTGGGSMSHADTALALAEAGFVVAAPTHSGDNFQEDHAVGTPAWLVDRSRHVSRVIDYMTGAWADRGRVDGRRVGVFGFSAGATTALIAIGGKPDLGRVATHCAERPEFACQLVKPGKPLANPPPPGWPHDRRIAAAVVAAPGLGFTFAPAGLAAVTAPVQLWTGAEDRIVPRATNADAVRRLLPAPPELHDVAGATHFSFLMPCGLLGPPALCKDGADFDRAAFHRDFNRSVVGFFKSHLAAR